MLSPTIYYTVEEINSHELDASTSKCAGDYAGVSEHRKDSIRESINFMRKILEIITIDKKNPRRNVAHLLTSHP